MLPPPAWPLLSGGFPGSEDLGPATPVIRLHHSPCRCHLCANRALCLEHSPATAPGLGSPHSASGRVPPRAQRLSPSPHSPATLRDLRPSLCASLSGWTGEPRSPGAPVPGKAPAAPCPARGAAASGLPRPSASTGPLRPSSGSCVGRGAVWTAGSLSRFPSQTQKPRVRGDSRGTQTRVCAALTTCQDRRGRKSARVWVQMAKQKACERQGFLSRGLNPETAQSPLQPRKSGARGMGVASSTAVPGWLPFPGLPIEVGGNNGGTERPHRHPGTGAPAACRGGPWERPLQGLPGGGDEGPPCGTVGEGAPPAQGLHRSQPSGASRKRLTQSRTLPSTPADTHRFGPVQGVHRPPEAHTWITEGSGGLGVKSLEGQEELLSPTITGCRRLSALGSVSGPLHFSTERQGG